MEPPSMEPLSMEPLSMEPLSMEPPFVELRGITKVYRREQAAVPVLDGVDLDIRRGERLAIMGRSGSGKSTLLNILGCLDSPTNGRYLLEGQDVSVLADEAVSQLRNATFGFVFQAFHLLRGLTITENVELPLEYSAVPADEQRQRALELLALVGLEHRVGHEPNELSGGERQRVAIARALVNRPRLLLADEPTGSLDSRAQRAILDLLTTVHATLGTTLVTVTHDPKVAEELGDRILHMSDGRLEG